MGTNGASEPQDPTERVSAPRARRDSFQGVRVSWRGLGAVLGALVFAGGVTASVWAMSAAFGSKAESSKVEALEKQHLDDFHALDKKVDRIWIEQRAFIRHQAPELERELPAPEDLGLKPFPEAP